MTGAKEKAKELFGKHLKVISDVNPLNSYTRAAIKASMVCVDEIISIDTHPTDGRVTAWGEFYKEVREELLKL